MKTIYTDLTDLIELEVKPALNGFEKHFDCEAIARDCWELDDHGVYQYTGVDFWEVAQRHDLTKNWDPDSVDVYTTKDHGGATLIRKTTNEGIVKCHGIRVGRAHLAFKARCESGYMLDMVAEAERKLRKLEEKYVPINCDEHITIEVI